MVPDKYRDQKIKDSHGVTICEAYKDYTPPAHIDRTVERLLGGVPPKYLAGLATVVLTNSGKLSHDQRKGKTKSRGRKVPMVECRGFYYHELQGEPAWIKLLLDNIFKAWPRWLVRIHFFRSLAIAQTLYHELGHHIHRTQVPMHKEPEKVAEDWGIWLSRYYIRKHYWYLVPMFFVLSFLLRPVWKHEKSGRGGQVVN